MQYSTMQYNTIQYNTIHNNITQYNTTQYQYNTIQCNAIRYNTIQYNIINNVRTLPHTRTGEYEMMLLESTLEKITSLLRVGFGEAGAGIIRANLNMQDGTCTINPLLPGKILVLLKVVVNLKIWFYFVMHTIYFETFPVIFMYVFTYLKRIPFLLFHCVFFKVKFGTYSLFVCVGDYDISVHRSNTPLSILNCDTYSPHSNATYDAK